MATDLTPTKINQTVLHVREAMTSDIDFLKELEEECFPIHRRSTVKSLKNSLLSSTQVVFISETVRGRTRTPTGAAIIFLYKRSLRIYSIALKKEFRGHGAGEGLLQKAVEYAGNHSFEKISLEADSTNSKLIDWYSRHDFKIERFLPDYYGSGESAYRMTRKLVDTHHVPKQFIIVSDAIHKDDLNIPEAKVYTPEEYMTGDIFLKSNRFHILNLCKSYRTHTMGYYVSLMASARNHRITPSIMAVKDISNISIAQSLLDEIKESAIKKLKTVSEDAFELIVILGKTPSSTYASLAKKLYGLFEVPFFSIKIEVHSTWKIKKINTLSLRFVMKNYPELLRKGFSEIYKKRRYNRTRLKTYKYDLAILVNENEATPPSCPAALEKFRRAAEQVGFFVEFINKSDFRRICEFDALFIRETTAVESHTYSMARHAYTEGLVVIDDPWSILLCSNKVYLHEKLANTGVCQPKGRLLTKRTCTPSFIAGLPFPLVLKLPESSFSQGVFRVKNAAELKEKLNTMFSRSAIIIAQEFLKSEYDWRIGILDNTPLFACKYYMADHHWQIYNWKFQENDEFSGKSETVPVSEVPPHILKAAVRATSLIGNGLYGVDLKDLNGKACVIEVNDNPNIDAGIEDSILGDDLYLRIMTSIYDRIEAERRQVRYLI